MPIKDISNWCFDNAFISVSTALYFIRTHPFIKRNRVWLFQCLSLLLMNAICLILLTNSIFLHDAKSGNYTDASKNFAMLIICFNSNMKFYTMVYHQKSIAGLIKTMDRDYELANEFNEEERDIITSYSKKANKISQMWIIVAIGTNTIFPAKAFYLMVYYYSKGEAQLVPMFDLTFPDIIEQYKTSFLAYVGIFGLCYIFDCFATIVYIGFEPLIPIFTLHTCGQLKLLSLKISKVIYESENEEEMKEKFKKIDLKLQELYSFIDHVQNDFMMLMEFNMKTTTFILPCNAFLLLQEFREKNVINVEFIFVLVASLIHFLTPCYFCDLLMESSENFRQAIYSCGWENCRYKSIRKTVLLMLTRAGKPFSVSTIFYFISLDTFSTMCRQAYAIFNLMTAAWT